MRASGHCHAAALLVAALGLAACNTDAPTSSSATSPLITSVTPQAPVASGAPQTLLIRGERFFTALELTITPPGGGTFAVPPAAIQALQSSSFQATLVLESAGTHVLTVRNANGDASPPFTLVVLGTPGATAPQIFGIAPSSLVRGTQLQEISIQGANFAAGLVVQITEPDATLTQHTGSAISGLTSTQFQLTMAFTKVGNYSLRVVNPSGESSNVVNLFVAQ
jgi:hypothetical protein